MKRKLLFLILTLTLGISITSCANKQDTVKEQKETQTNTTKQDETETDATEDEQTAENEETIPPLKVEEKRYYSNKDGIEIKTSYQIPVFENSEDEENYPALKQVFDELRKNLDEEAQKHYEDYSEYIQLVGDLMSGNLMQNEKELTITRFDEKYISFTIETTMYEDGNHQYYNVVGKTYDVQTGEEVNLQDVVNDKDLFLQKYEDGIRFNFGDSYDYLSPNPNKYFEKLRATDGLDLTWCLNYEGITIYAYYEFSNHDLPSQVAKLYYDDAPSAYNREYFDIGDEYIFPSANTVTAESAIYPLTSAPKSSLTMSPA